MTSNNDLLSDLAELVRKSGMTNNDLLKLIADNSRDDGGVVKQPSLTKLNQDEVSEWDIVEKINEVIQTLHDAKVTE